jgi:hypothetical protein
MPLQKLLFKPGINRENTSYANEGGYYAANKIRFRSGQPEKVGGWTADTGTNLSTLKPTTGTLWGVCRALWNWLNLTGYNLLALGTNLKYYIQSGTSGYYYDVTPIRTTTSAGEVTFAASTGSPIITVTDAGHGAQTDDFVTYSGAVSLGGNITADILNAEFQITYLSSNTYTITTSVNATAGDSGNGGASVIGAYQITTGNPFYPERRLGRWYLGRRYCGYSNHCGFRRYAVKLKYYSHSNLNNWVCSIRQHSDRPRDYILRCYWLCYNLYWVCSRVTRKWCWWRCWLWRGCYPYKRYSSCSVHHIYWLGCFGSCWSRYWRTTSHMEPVNFGEDLIFNPRGGALYYWANSASANTFNRGQYLGPSTGIVTKNGTITTDSSCPTVANFVTVSDASRFVLVFGLTTTAAQSKTPY